QWSVVGGAKQRVESEFDARYESGRERSGPFSFLLESVYDRSGTPRFYGIGNDTAQAAQSVYTAQQAYLQAQLGRNFTPAWQLAYLLRPRRVRITAGQLRTLPSTLQRFPALTGLGTTHELLQRLQLSYDTRDDLTVPTRGTYAVLYGGLGDQAVFARPLFTETGFEARTFVTPLPSLTLALRAGLRVLPRAKSAPFWELSSLGGDESALGGSLPLRGFGTARFYDRNALSASLEGRWRVAAFDAFATHLELQLTPFVDGGRVFAAGLPLQGLHTAAGVGLRAVARPFVVGYLDVGRGSEGVVAFSGINYPF
ncbi:MAG: BamA/TamA family outer membrane protein, partial [Gammaproteobacteria bacterium]|nr:BamA/TamA family outer membrane protein [Gammaproteobacteria bacterium]